LFAFVIDIYDYLLYENIHNFLQTCSQVLMTRDMLATPRARSAACATFQELLKVGIVPVVNENDAVAIDGQKIGDNDTLAAQVAALVRAGWLFLLTDVDGLYTANPSVDPTARRIEVVSDIASLKVSTAPGGDGSGSESGDWGTGGMATKLTAASFATAAGVHMVICGGEDPAVISQVVLEGQRIGTLFLPTVNLARTGSKRVSKKLVSMDALDTVESGRDVLSMSMSSAQNSDISGDSDDADSASIPSLSISSTPSGSGSLAGSTSTSYAGNMNSLWAVPEDQIAQGMESVVMADVCDG
jgi:glutamate 5-kinase